MKTRAFFFCLLTGAAFGQITVSEPAGGGSKIGDISKGTLSQRRYLMTTFVTQEDRLRLAGAMDPLFFNKASGPIFKPTGNNYVRDPQPMLLNGDIYTFYTSGIFGAATYFGIAKATDWVNFQNYATVSISGTGVASVWGPAPIARLESGTFNYVKSGTVSITVGVGPNTGGSGHLGMLPYIMRANTNDLTTWSARETVVAASGTWPANFIPNRIVESSGTYRLFGDNKNTSSIGEVYTSTVADTGPYVYSGTYTGTVYEGFALVPYGNGYLAIRDRYSVNGLYQQVLDANFAEVTTPTLLGGFTNRYSNCGLLMVTTAEEIAKFDHAIGVKLQTSGSGNNAFETGLRVFGGISGSKLENGARSYMHLANMEQVGGESATSLVLSDTTKGGLALYQYWDSVTASYIFQVAAPGGSARTAMTLSGTNNGSAILSVDGSGTFNGSVKAAGTGTFGTVATTSATAVNVTISGSLTKGGYSVANFDLGAEAISGLSQYARFTAFRGVLNSGTDAGNLQGATTWNDVSGNVRNATSGTWAPNYDAFKKQLAFINQGSPGVARMSFSGSGIDGRNYSVFVIGEMTNLRDSWNGSTTTSYYTLTALGSQRFEVVGHYGAGDGRVGYYDGTTRRTSTTLYAKSGLTLFGFVSGTANAKVIVNDQEETLMASGTASGNFSIGATTDVDDSFYGTIKAVIVLDHMATGLEIEAVRQYAKILGVRFSPYRRLIVVGDSISAGALATNNQDWVRRMALSDSVELYKSSLGGITLATLISQNRERALYNANQTNVAILFAGTNDIANSASGTTAHDRMQTMAQQLQRLGYKVVVVTMLPRSGTDTERGTFNTLIRSNWQNYADALADIAADTRIGDNGDNNDTTYYASDHIHPTSAGHQIIADIIGPVAEQVFTSFPGSVFSTETSGTLTLPSAAKLLLWTGTANTQIVSFGTSGTANVLVPVINRSISSTLTFSGTSPVLTRGGPFSIGPGAGATIMINSSTIGTVW